LSEAVGEDLVEVNGVVHVVLVRGDISSFVRSADQTPKSWLIFSSRLSRAMRDSTRSAVEALESRHTGASESEAPEAGTVEVGVDNVVPNL